MYYIIWMISIFENVSSEAVPTSGEIEYRSGKFSIGFHLLLPVAGLGLIIFGRRHILDKILLQLDRKCLTVLCPSFIKRENVLKWACSRLPPTWSSHSVETLSGGIKELWTDGSLLCTLINTAIPGACPNPHRHWKQSPTHAQALAFKYLGITPIFTNEDLNRKLTLRLERKFIRYLSEIQQLVNKISENAENERKVSSRYIVRGMGLFSGEQNKKTTFYIYLNEHNDDDDDVEGTIIIQIKGPYGTYGEAVTPKLINKKRKIRNKRKQERRPSIQFIENLMQSNTWNFTRSQKKYINEGIEIVTAMENDRIKVTYTPTNYGMYEINMISRGELLKGCPFSVHIFINEFGQNAEVEKENVQKKKTVRRSTKSNTLADLPERVEIKRQTELKPTFKFNEVVDEITKNGLVYRNILGHTPENETTNLEISADIENKNENHLSVSAINDMNIPDFDTKKDDDIILNYINLDDSKIRQFDNFIKSNKNIKPTEGSTESFSSSSNEISETIFVDKKITDDKSSKHVTDNVKINSATIFANKNLINESEKTQLGNSFVFESKYVNTVNINKIKIPELFKDNQVNNCSCYLDDKYFKNILNESNKVTRRFSNIKTYNELNNNKHKSYNNVNAVEVDRNKTILYTNQIYKDTSPICPQHIVPEVEIIPKTVAEKRKVFAQRSLGSAFSSKISSFSSENERESIDKDYETQGLGVLNIVNNLEESDVNNPSAETWSLCNTLSLPNLSLESEYSYVISIKDKKDFWENVSSYSSSSLSTKSLSPKKENTTSELERSKLIWKKSGNSFNACNNVILSENVYKSADDILSMTSPYEGYSKYKSVDDSLDECAFLSIEERKRLLLNEFYEKENLNKKTQRKKMISVKDQMISENNEAKKILENKNLDEYCTPLSEKIKKYSSALELSTNTSKEILPNLKTTRQNPDIRKKPEALIATKKTLTVHSQFKKAINYFKKLETQSHDKPIKPKKKLNSQNNLKSHLGGSLNIPSVSQKFFINNLYQDVFGNKKSNFRGTPNKSALVEALATFSRNPKRSNDNEDDIKFEIFKGFGKSRKRKSLKSVFDIHY